MGKQLHCNGSMYTCVINDTIHVDNVALLLADSFQTLVVEDRITQQGPILCDRRRDLGSLGGRSVGATASSAHALGEFHSKVSGDLFLLDGRVDGFVVDQNFGGGRGGSFGLRHDD